MTAMLSELQILGVGFGFSRAKVLLTAVELGVFSCLGEHAMSAAELASALDLRARGVVDFFDTLLALGFLERHEQDGERLYQNTEETAHFLDRASPGYIGGLLDLWNKRAYQFWDGLGESLKTGQPQNEVRNSDRPMFEVLYEEQARLQQFSNSMAILSRRNFQALSQKFDFSRYQTLCDVGGASGLLTRIVAAQHTHLQCITFDLPQVAEIARAAIEKDQLSARIEVRSGDFFKDGFPAADVITMGMILHDWNLEKKLHLIRLAYAALPPGGVFIVVESLIDDERRENVVGLLTSLQMMLEFGDAFDYTGADFCGWCKEVGFEHCEVMHLNGPFSAGIAYK